MKTTPEINVKETAEDFFSQPHVRHSLKLVPETQRELFVSEMTEYVKKLLQAERQKREEMVEEILKKLQLLVDVKTQGTGMVGYQLTGRYPTTGEYLLERELQTYYEVTVSIETIAKKYGIALTQPNKK